MWGLFPVLVHRGARVWCYYHRTPTTSFIRAVRPGTGIVLRASAIPRDLCDAMDYDQWDSLMESFLSRAKVTEASLADGTSARDPELAATHPNLHEAFTATLGTGSSRENRFSLSMWTQGSSWRLVLRDKGDGTCLWVTGTSLSDLWTSLEAALADPTTEWRLDRLAGHATAKRVSKRS